MGKITLSVEGTTVGTVAAGNGITVSYEVNEQDSERLIKAFGEMQAQRFMLSGIDPSLLKEPTVQGIVQAWFDGVINQSIEQVKTHEREKAARAAQQEVPPLVVTSK